MISNVDNIISGSTSGEMNIENLISKNFYCTIGFAVKFLGESLDTFFDRTSSPDDIFDLDPFVNFWPNQSTTVKSKSEILKSLKPFSDLDFRHQDEVIVVFRSERFHTIYNFLYYITVNLLRNRANRFN